MPNWCGNSVTLRHENPEMIKRAVDAFAAGRFCQEFHPIPAELKDTQSPNSVNAADLIEKTGYADWYDFCTNEWEPNGTSALAMESMKCRRMNASCISTQHGLHQLEFTRN